MHQRVCLPAVKLVFPLTWGTFGILHFLHLLFFFLIFLDITIEPHSHIFLCNSKVPPLRITCSPFKYDKGASLNHFIKRFPVLGCINRLLFSVCRPQRAHLHCTVRCPERANTGQWSDLKQNGVMMHRFLLMASLLWFAFISRRTCLCVMRRRGTSAVHLLGRS